MKLIDYLFESAHPGGTYSSLIPSVESKEEIFAFCNSAGIPNLVESDKYHCTLIYSRKPCQDISGEDYELPCKALPIGYKILGDEHKVLVLELYCPQAVRLHTLFRREYGATHDYDTYIPHITIAKDFTGELPIDIPTCEVDFSGYTIEELS